MASRRGGAAHEHVTGPFVRIDHSEVPGYRLGIYSPSDTPVTASAGVFLVHGVANVEPVTNRVIGFVDGKNLFYAAKQAFAYSYPNYDAGD